MSDHEGIPADEKVGLVSRLMELSTGNRQSVETLRGRGKAVHPAQLLEEKIDTFIDLAFGEIPKATSIPEFAEQISDARLIFEVEWQERQRRVYADATRKAAADEIVVPPSNGKLILP